MNFSGTGASTGDKKLSTTKSLNPNAAEFVPFALRSQAGDISTANSSGKSILNRSESSITNNSDEEAQQYWRHQLPDDITLDFIDEVQENNNLPLSSISQSDVFGEKMRFPLFSHVGNDFPSPTAFQPSLSKPWEKQISASGNLLSREAIPYNGNSRNGFLVDVPNEPLLVENSDVGPLEFLASQFPGFADESLAEVYFTNGGDLNLTIEMLTQLELQVDGGMNQNLHSNLNPNSVSAPNLSALDFPALSLTDGENDFYSNVTPYRSSEKSSPVLFRSSSSIGATDFASAVRKIAPQDSGSIWKYDANGSSNTSIGSSRSFNGRGGYGDRLQNRASSAWLETGEAVANMYSEMREEARDHARVRNSYFEQARQAYLIGNKALAKELSVKGQLHNIQMKAAHGKAQESIYRQRVCGAYKRKNARSPNTSPAIISSIFLRNPDMHGTSRERMIDLHGLHVSEAIHVLKRELAVTKNVTRSADQRQLIYICVGTGHHTRGARTPSRLPIAVQQYLLEEEGLQYSEPQPGLLRVVI